MVSQTAEYALRAMVALLSRKDATGTAQDLARESQVPLDYLSKVLNCLARAGVITSQRGRGGGFQPARPASQLTVLEVVAAVDPVKRITRCPLGIPGHESLCPLHRKLDDAARSVEEAFGSTTIESLCEKSGCHAAA